MVKHRKYPKEEKDGEIARLKKQIKRLVKEKEKLKSDIRTLEAAFGITVDHIDGKLDGIPVEKVVRSAKKKSKLSATIKENTPKCERCGTDGMTVIKTSFNETHLCKLCNHRKVVKNGNDEKQGPSKK
jgi:hypothetical protein